MRSTICWLMMLGALGATMGCDSIPFLSGDEETEETTADNPPETAEEAEAQAQQAIEEAQAAAQEAQEQAQAAVDEAQAQAGEAQEAAGEAVAEANEAAEEAGEAAEETAEAAEESAEAAEETAEAAEETAEAAEETAEAAAAGGSNSATAACEGEADPHQCVIDRLEGRARYAHQFSALIDAHRAKGNRSAAIRNAQEFLRRFRTHGRAARYRRFLERSGVSVN